MITQRTGDLLTSDVDVIVHQANLHHSFGGGIAAAIGRIWPEAFEADLETDFGNPRKLGTFSLAHVSDLTPKQVIKYVANMYSQREQHIKGSLTDYEAMRQALTNLRNWLAAKGFTLGIPWRIGAGIAGGDWKKIEGIICEVFEDSDVNVVIYQRPEDAVVFGEK